jgi:hypothetical protein
MISGRASARRSMVRRPGSGGATLRPIVGRYDVRPLRTRPAASRNPNEPGAANGPGSANEPCGANEPSAANEPPGTDETAERTIPWSRQTKRTLRSNRTRWCENRARTRRPDNPNEPSATSGSVERGNPQKRRHPSEANGANEPSGWESERTQQRGSSPRPCAPRRSPRRRGRPVDRWGSSLQKRGRFGCAAARRRRWR